MSAAQPPAVELGGEEWQGSGTVLVVDDDDMVCMITQAMVEFLGFQVLTAADGRLGIEVLRRHDEVALVILDLTMPRMNGEEAFIEMRRIRPELPILIATGFDEQETIRRFEGHVPSGFLHKPYEIATLREKIRAALG